MVLVNTFEENFGDLFDSGEGVWSELSKTDGLCPSHYGVAPTSIILRTRRKKSSQFVSLGVQGCADMDTFSRNSSA